MFYYNTEEHNALDDNPMEGWDYLNCSEMDNSPTIATSSPHKNSIRRQQNPHAFHAYLRKVLISTAFLTASILFISMINLSDGLITHMSPNEAAAASFRAEDKAQSIDHSTVPNQNKSQLLITDCLVSHNFPSRILKWCQMITAYSGEYNLPADVIAAIIWQESGGDPRAYSHSGAVGLMQVMPSDGLAASFMCVSGPCFKDRPTTDQLMEPEFNIKYGTRMLARLLNQYGDLREALKFYGPMDVGYYYADKVLGLYKRYGKKS